MQGKAQAIIYIVTPRCGTYRLSIKLEVYISETGLVIQTPDNFQINVSTVLTGFLK